MEHTPCENCNPDGVYVELCTLHAAAPELLKALEGMMGVGDGYCDLFEYAEHDLGDIDEAKKRIAQASAAIKAAKEDA